MLHSRGGSSARVGTLARRRVRRGIPCAAALLQLANPEARLLPVGLPFGFAGAAVSLLYTLRRR